MTDFRAKSEELVRRMIQKGYLLPVADGPLEGANFKMGPEPPENEPQERAFYHFILNKRDARIAEAAALLTVASAMGPPPTLAVDEAGGLVVSTVKSWDLGYETALIDANPDGPYPVERYETEEEARAGHARWVLAAPGLTTIVKLGYMDVVADERVTLVRT